MFKYILYILEIIIYSRIMYIFFYTLDDKFCWNFPKYDTLNKKNPKGEKKGFWSFMQKRVNFLTYPLELFYKAAKSNALFRILYFAPSTELKDFVSKKNASVCMIEIKQRKKKKKYVTVIMQNVQHVQEAVLANLWTLLLSNNRPWTFHLCLAS